MKRIGFLSFGHWSESPYSQVRSGSDALIQSIELAVAVEALGGDGAFYRVHHFANQLGSPFPLLAAVGARTNTIEIGTAVIDMRYENPLYMAEDAGAADLIAGGRLQLGISRGSPEQVIDGFRYFGYGPAEGETDADLARRHADVFLKVIEGNGIRRAEPEPDVPEPARPPQGRTVLAGAPRPHLVGCWDACDRRMGCGTGDEPHVVDADDRGHRRPVPRAPGRADPAVPGRLETGRPRARTARVGEPQHLPDRRRP
jgi:hypothetical protein